MPEQYRIGERVRVIVEGTIAHVTDGEELYPGELTIALKNPAGLYDVTVPLDVATLERLVPVEGEPQPGDLWQDRDGHTWFAHRDDYSGDIALRNIDGTAHRWQSANMTFGPLTRIWSAAEQPSTPEEPTLCLGDRWRDSDGDVWTVVNVDGELMLRRMGLAGSETWEFVTEQYGPLVLVERSGGAA